MVSNELRKLGIASTELLQDRLQHPGLLLDHLAELLKLGVVSEELEISHALRSSLSDSGGGGATAGRISTSRPAALLRGEVEQVYVALLVTTGSGCGGRGGSGSRWGSGRLGSGRALLLLDVVGNALLSSCKPNATQIIASIITYIQQVLDRAVWVEEGSTHGSIDLRSFKTHGFHVRNSLGALVTECQGIGVVEVGIGTSSSGSRCCGSGGWSWS